MTEKRYTLVKSSLEGYCFIKEDDFVCIAFLREEGARELVNLLNDFADENQELKQKVEKQKNLQIKLESRIRRLRKQLKELKKKELEE